MFQIAKKEKKPGRKKLKKQNRREKEKELMKKTAK
jgi:hypothetical protein